MKSKIFHDTIHGSILVPVCYCESIVDSILFQRLRRIEQTSMRSLFPCAHHDRFVHSIGVFHLGCQLVDYLEQNIKKNDSGLWNSLNSCWEKVTTSYKIACLLHDIGHAPFSHTFEHYYDYKRPNYLKEKLSQSIASKVFSQEINQNISAKPHEIASAYIASSHFKSAIKMLNGNIEYVARMITGCIFLSPKNLNQEFVNCMVKVLHGEIDVDRLDYAIRDQWAAGFSSSRLNIERLLRAITISHNNKNTRLEICFFKSALDQIESLVQIKDFQKKWVLRHHNILYDQNLLEKSVDKLAENLSCDIASPNEKKHTKEDVLIEIFNLEAFDNIDYKVCGHNLYLPTDDTLIHLLKQTLNKNEFAREWLSRIYQKQPLWKSAAEYKNIFKNTGNLRKEDIQYALCESPNPISQKDFLVIENEYISYAIAQSKVYININGIVVDYCDLVKQHNESSIIQYVYVSKKILKKRSKEEIIKDLQNIRKN